MSIRVDFLTEGHPPVEDYQGNAPFTQSAARVLMNAVDWAYVRGMDYVDPDAIVCAAMDEPGMRILLDTDRENNTSQIKDAISSINGSIPGRRPESLRLTPRFGWMMNYAHDNLGRRFKSGDPVHVVTIGDMMYGIIAEGESIAAGVLGVQLKGREKEIFGVIDVGYRRPNIIF